LGRQIAGFFPTLAARVAQEREAGVDCGRAGFGNTSRDCLCTFREALGIDDMV
jgi:hypothetical protein